MFVYTLDDLAAGWLVTVVPPQVLLTLRERVQERHAFRPLRRRRPALRFLTGVYMAIQFDRLLREKVVRNTTELAQLTHVTQPRITQVMQLLHLAPDIQEELLFLPPIQRGRDNVTEKHLRAIAAEPDWRRQRAMWSQLKMRP